MGGKKDHKETEAGSMQLGLFAEMRSRRGSGFFTNTGCEHYPCHSGLGEGLNCLFCFCPLYHGECPGDPVFLRLGDKEIKDCSGCAYPHRAENYELMIAHLRKEVSDG